MRAGAFKIQQMVQAAGVLLALWAGLFAFYPAAWAQEVTQPINPPPASAQLAETVKRPVVELTQGEGEETWRASGLETFGLKFVVRAKEALRWSLSLEEEGFRSAAIENTHDKVLVIANSFFILGLLALAGMWLFRIFLPRQHLKKTLMVYGAAVLFINFALPANQLLIDGANLLQRTLMTRDDGSVAVTEVVRTPQYLASIVYRPANKESVFAGQVEWTMTPATPPTLPVSSLSIAPEDSTAEEVIPPVISTTLPSKAELQTPPLLSAETEQSVFTFTMLVGTGTAYFLMALTLIMRIVILWGLLVVSPLLLMLAIFKSTRGWFLQWLGLYGRWLLAGPLLALGLSVVLNIWQVAGLPLSAGLGSEEQFGPAGAIAFYLPGKSTANTLSTTTQMMEYVVFLIMLYLPLFFAFALTRGRTVQAVGQAVRLATSPRVSAETPVRVVIEKDAPPQRPASMFQTLTRQMSDKIAAFTRKTFPEVLPPKKDLSVPPPKETFANPLPSPTDSFSSNPLEP